MSSMLQLSSAVITHPGKKRPHNEDFAAYYEPETHGEWLTNGAIYIVADGVGGAAKGEKASQFATEDVLYRYDNDPNPDLGSRLSRAMRAAGNTIYDHAQRTGIRAQMATTMVAAVVHGDRVTIANVGDSRAYLIRDGQAEQLTSDHTVAGEMLRYGEVTEEEAQNMKGKNRITRSLGGERDVKVDVFADISLRPGDKLLLCSDGLTRYTLLDDVARLTAQGPPSDIVQRCVSYANQRGGTDNIAVALVDVGNPVPAGTVPAAGGAAPTQVAWEDMPTLPSAFPQRRQRRFRLTWLHLVLIGVVFIVAAAALIFVVSKLFPRQENALSSSTTQTYSALETLHALSGTNDENITIEALESTPSPEQPLVSPSPDIKQTTTDGSTSEATQEMGCIYTVQGGDHIDAILRGFEYDDTEVLDLRNLIIDLESNEPLPDPDEIDPEQQLFIPFIENEEECSDGGGEWQVVPPPDGEPGAPQ